MPVFAEINMLLNDWVCVKILVALIVRNYCARILRRTARKRADYYGFPVNPCHSVY